MQKTLSIFLLLLSLCSRLLSIQQNDLTYEFLANSEYTDHVKNFKKLFEQMKVHSFLEFGLGYGTKYFLDHCDEVTSYEIILPDQTPQWFEETRKLFSNTSHWKPVLKRVGRSMQFANDLYWREKKDAALYDATYLLDLKEICDELFKERSFDVVFVDPGFHMRGDLVNELFGRAPIIVAHDTNISPPSYGWQKINTPSDYQKIVFKEGQGTTFWIHKDKKELIAALGVTPEPINKKKLRIFFPDMHVTLVQSMISALNALGHTLVLPGESFNPNSSRGLFKLSVGNFYKKDPSQPFEVIENDEIFSNPPDVLCVNCLELERDIYAIWGRLRGRGISPKIIHYSGNTRSRFNSKFVKNLIAVDAYTASLFRQDQLNLTSWIPWVDFEQFSFEGVSDNPILNTYIGHYYAGTAMEKSVDCFNSIVDRAHADFPDVAFQVFPAPHSFISHDALRQHMDQSCATIHIKEKEGFGYTIIESIAKGRPVFLKRSFSLGNRLMNWCIEGKTAFFFDTYEEFHAKLQKFLRDREYRHQVQKECAATTRKLIDNEKQLKLLDHFLQNLKDTAE